MHRIGILLAAVVGLFATPALGGPAVRIDSGTVEGTVAGDVRVFRGIPYAAPPVGALRWRPPQSPSAWTGARPATDFGPACPQPDRGDGIGGGRATRQSEDCLTLNVWAPADARGAPVMVWIHGGGHRLGASSFPIYNGEAFARQGVILVSINYRLGLLGYFAHPALTRAAPNGEAIGNYGFMDQLAALQWVQRNIAAFGGDPHNVTVFGESAGGASLIYLLTNPSARGLFQKAIVQSGGGIQNPANLAQEEAGGVSAAARIGLGPDATIEAMRARPAEDWVRALGPLEGLGFGPFIDGRLITEPPWRVFAEHRAIDVPLIIGSNSNEASVMGPLGVRATATQFAGPRAAEMRAAYGGVPDQEMTRQALGDVTFGAPARFVAQQTAAGAPTYLYYFSYTPVVRRQQAAGAGHGSEIPYIFQSWNQIPLLGRFVRPQDERMAATMSACWVAFARSGAPACPGAPAWPAYDPRTDALMEFGSDETAVRSHFRRAQYDFIMRRIFEIAGR